MTEDQLKDLLRERAELFKAPENYSHDLLRALHLRQRTEILKQPLWRIAWERLTTFLGEHSLSTPTYIAALATITIVGLISIVTLGSTSKPLSAELIAKNREIESQKAAQKKAPSDPQKGNLETLPVKFEKP
jgi:hypothetical protein